MDISSILKRFGVTLRGPFALIEWKPIAKRYCIGGTSMKRIVVYSEHGNPIKVFPYHSAYIEYLENLHRIPVIDVTAGQPIPEVCITEPVMSPMGVIWGDIP